MSPMVDFANVADGFEPIPEGTYVARKTGHELKDSKSSQYQYYSVEYTIDEGEFADRKVWDNYSLNPKSLFAMKKALVALGAEFTGEDDTDDLWDEVDGAECRLVVKQRTYEDPDSGESKIQNDIKSVLAPSVRI